MRKRIFWIAVNGSLHLMNFMVIIGVFSITGFAYPLTNFSPSLVDTLFLTQDLLKIKIQIDWMEIQDDRGKDPAYHHAFIILEDKTKIPIKLRARGNNRKRKEVCEIPPFKIEFGDKPLKDGLFKGHEEIKLVTFCQGDDLVIAEYLIYEMYQILEPRSLDVRLARIDYVDPNGIQITRSFAFFLEDIDHLAERINGDEENDRMDPEDMDRASITLLYLFQYMIGNIDWDLKMMKNIKLIKFENKPILPVPYDFDYSLMVDAPYFPTYEGIPIERRRFRRICREPEEFRSIFSLFEQKKDELYRLVKEFPHFRSSKQKNMLNYLDLFYQEISDSEDIKQIFLDTCKEG